MTEADAPTLRPRRAHLSRRTRILLIVGGAVALVLALVAGLLIATSLAQQAAADERRAAAKALTEARSALDDAVRRIDTATGSLDEAITAADAGLAVAGPGLDDAARPALQGARDDAAEVREAEAEAEGEGMYGDQIVAQPDDDGATASALRRQAELYADDAKAATKRAERIEGAVEDLETAIAAYLTAAQTTGEALLAERSDAADDVRAALQAQLDTLPDAEPAVLADTLAAYRSAVDAVIASSDAARTPATPGGTGVRVSDPTSLTAVVNKRRGLAADYVPPGLVTPSGIPGATQVRQELLGPLESMRAAMAAEATASSRAKGSRVPTPIRRAPATRSIRPASPSTSTTAPAATSRAASPTPQEAAGSPRTRGSTASSCATATAGSRSSATPTSRGTSGTSAWTWRPTCTSVASGRSRSTSGCRPPPTTGDDRQPGGGFRGHAGGVRAGPVLGRPCPDADQLSWKVFSSCDSTVSCS